MRISDWSSACALPIFPHIKNHLVHGARGGQGSGRTHARRRVIRPRERGGHEAVPHEYRTEVQSLQGPCTPQPTPFSHALSAPLRLSLGAGAAWEIALSRFPKPTLSALGRSPESCARATRPCAADGGAPRPRCAAAPAPLHPDSTTAVSGKR